MNPIRAGLEHLREIGWTNQSGVCMYLSHSQICGEALSVLDAVCLEQFPDRASAVDGVDDHATFVVNDDPETTFEDIERIMEKAAIRLDELV